MDPAVPLVVDNGTGVSVLSIGPSDNILTARPSSSRSDTPALTSQNMVRPLSSLLELRWPNTNGCLTL